MGRNLHSGRVAIFARCLAAALCILVGCSSADPADAQGRIHYSGYDGHFQRAAARWLPEYDWHWLRAQCYQESAFDPRAVSPAGARGLCQFMPGTWADAVRSLGVTRVFSPAENVWAAGWYMRRRVNVWTARPRTAHQRLQLGQASYNAGLGNILAAQRLCSNALTWQEIKRCLPDVTGQHSAETIDYVVRIQRWYEISTGQRQ